MESIPVPNILFLPDFKLLLVKPGGPQRVGKLLFTPRVTRLLLIWRLCPKMGMFEEEQRGGKILRSVAGFLRMSLG